MEDINEEWKTKEPDAFNLSFIQVSKEKEPLINKNWLLFSAKLPPIAKIPVYLQNNFYSTSSGKDFHEFD